MMSKSKKHGPPESAASKPRGNLALDKLIVAHLLAEPKAAGEEIVRDDKQLINRKFKELSGGRALDPPRKSTCIRGVLKAGFHKLLADAPDPVRDAYDEIADAREFKEKLNDLARARWLGHERPFPISRVFVFDTKFKPRQQTEKPTEDWDKKSEQVRFARFADEAARRLQGILKQAENIGVGWGRTLAESIEALAKLELGHLTRRKNKEITIAATCGQIIKANSASHSSSYLALRLSEIIYTKKHAENHALTFFGVGSILPKKWLRHQKKPHSIKTYFRFSEGYKRVFDPDPEFGEPFVDRIDTLLTSVSRDGALAEILRKELVEVGGFVEDDVKKASVGDIGGAFMRRESLDQKGQKLLDQIQEAWTGIRLRHYREIASRAHKNGKPGVVILAMGRNKVETVIHAVRRGLVNTLIIDLDLKKALETHEQLSKAKTAEVVRRTES